MVEDGHHFPSLNISCISLVLMVVPTLISFSLSLISTLVALGIASSPLVSFDVIRLVITFDEC